MDAIMEDALYKTVLKPLHANIMRALIQQHRA